MVQVPGGTGYIACDFRATLYIFRLFYTQNGCFSIELSYIGFQTVTDCIAELMVLGFFLHRVGYCS